MATKEPHRSKRDCPFTVTEDIGGLENIHSARGSAHGNSGPAWPHQTDVLTGMEEWTGKALVEEDSNVSCEPLLPRDEHDEKAKPVGG